MPTEYVKLYFRDVTWSQKSKSQYDGIIAKLDKSSSRDFIDVDVFTSMEPKSITWRHREYSPVSSSVAHEQIYNTLSNDIKQNIKIEKADISDTSLIKLSSPILLLDLLHIFTFKYNDTVLDISWNFCKDSSLDTVLAVVPKVNNIDVFAGDKHIIIL